MEVEPWLRGTLAEVEPVRRAVLHALELAGEDAERWCEELSDRQMFTRPAGLHPTEQGRSAGTPGLPPVGFHLRHIARSLDRLLTYAEGGALSREQMWELRTEMEGEDSAAAVMAEFREGLRRAMERVRAILPESFAEVRGVGRKQLPTTVAGLLIHCAEHTQRHVGQMVTTAKLLSS